jgi:predicted GNAT family N-acyltransferase
MPGESEIIILQVTDDWRMGQVYAIRRHVFIEEQRVPEELERDDDDARAFHALALDAALPVGCGRMVPHDDHVKIGRMAVMRERRASGIGRRLLRFLMDEARRQGYRKAVLHAQLTAESFYIRNGYIPTGEPFEEAGIMHRRMECDL